MKSLYLTVIIITLIITNNITGLAQNESKGYIVTIDHDTIVGFITDQTDADMSLKIKFKKELLNTSTTQYSATELLGFGFKNGRAFDQLSIAKRPKDTIKVFAKRILQGKINLHVWRRLKGDDYLFMKNNETLRSVYMTKPANEIISRKDGSRYTLDGNKHVGLLIYVKADSSNTLPSKEDIRYSKKKIIKNIMSYNTLSQIDFPTKQYKEQKKYTNDITVGMPIINKPEGQSFRIAFYRNKTYPEKSRKISFLRCISYRHWTSSKEFDSNVVKSNLNFRQNWLSVLPFGINFHSASGIVRPYCYLGIGMSLVVMTNHHVVDFKDLGNTNEILVLPAVNLGAGAKIKLGNKYLLCELTPTGNYSGIFLNIGFSF